MNGRICLRVRDVAMSSLRPSDDDTSDPAFPWSTFAPQREAAAPPQAAKRKLAVTIRISPPHCLLAVTQDCDWAPGGRAAYESRRAAAQGGIACLVLLCESFSKLHGPLSGSRGSGTGCGCRRRESTLVVNGRRRSLRKQEGSSPPLWCETKTESCSVLSASQAGWEGLFFTALPELATAASSLHVERRTAALPCSSLGFSSTYDRITDFSFWVSLKSCLTVTVKKKLGVVL